MFTDLSMKLRFFSFRINNICGRIDATDHWQNMILFSRKPKVEEDLAVSERATRDSCQLNI